MQRAEERKETSGVTSIGGDSHSAGDQLETRANRNDATANRWGGARTLHEEPKYIALCLVS